MKDPKKLKKQLLKNTLLSTKSLNLIRALIESSEAIKSHEKPGYVTLGPFGYAEVSPNGSVVAISAPWSSPKGLDLTDAIPPTRLAKAIKLRWKAGTSSSISRLVRLLVKKSEVPRPVDVAGATDFDLSRSSRYLEEQTTRFAPEAPSTGLFEPEVKLSSRKAVKS